MPNPVVLVTYMYSTSERFHYCSTVIDLQLVHFEHQDTGVGTYPGHYSHIYAKYCGNLQ